MHFPDLMLNPRKMLSRRWYRVKDALALKSAGLSTQVRWWFRRPGRPHALPGELIVSLTSYGPRLGTIAKTLKCLLTQSCQPDRVILWIGHADAARLPPEVSALTAAGLEIRTTDDIGPYTKIIPALHAFPRAFIMTADDDLFYPRDWAEGLVNGYRDPHIIPCYRAHEIVFEAPNHPKRYALWRHHVPCRKVSDNYFATGVGGVLYPPGCFAPEVLDRELFLRICPGADDVWLYWMARRNGVTYQTVGKRRELVTWDGTQEVGLVNSNWGQGNDLKIANMIAHFGFPPASGRS
jgi:hypothetical protein